MYIKVRVIPGAKTETILKKSEDHFEVSVKEEAERNMVNRKIMELIAHHYSIPPRKIRIVSGHHSRSKILSVGT